MKYKILVPLHYIKLETKHPNGKKANIGPFESRIYTTNNLMEKL